MRTDRRQFLAHSARLLSLAALSAAFPSAALSRTAAYPFSLGAASGSPRATSVVLWTRILPDPLDAQSAGSQPYTVRWEVAEDEGFRQIAAKGTAAALPELAHSLHVDAGGLKPDRWYWYRFMLGDAVSPIGRTRTAPASNRMTASLKLAVASCQHWDFGQYAAHRHIAAEAPDLIAFLGDYIYEWGEHALTHPAAAPRRSNESLTLAQYRARYAQYKSDPHLQASHLAAPWIVTWDDHEVSNDYGNDRDERLDPNFMARRAAAYQAFYEHMPIRLHAMSAAPAGPQRFAQLRIHDRFEWGRLAQFHLLDNRQYRSYQACQKPERGGSTVVGAACAERTAPERSLLGAAQEQWLYEGFAASKAAWNLVAQQTLMAQCSQKPVGNEDGGRFWNDGWDGYPAARRRLLDSMRKHDLSNPLVLSGDVHTFYAAELRPDFDRAASKDNPVIATELCATSVTSGSRPQSRTDRYVADNPHIKYGRSDRRGYMMLEVKRERVSTRFQALDDVRIAESGASTAASFVIEDGQPRLQKA